MENIKLNSAICYVDELLIYVPTYKVKESGNRPGVAQRVPGALGSQIS